MAKHSSIFAGESYGQRSLAGYSLWGCTEGTWDTTEVTQQWQHISSQGTAVEKKHIQQDSPILPWGRTPEARTWFPWLSPQAPSPLLMCLISICRNKS